MAEGAKLANDIFERAQEQYGAARDFYPGIMMTVFTLSDPRNTDLWERMRAYCEEEIRDNK